MADSLQVLWPAEDQMANMRFDICTNGSWRTVSARTVEGPELSLRPSAIQMLKKAGITHILAAAYYDGIGIIGDKMVYEAIDWNLDVVANLNEVYLLKLR